MVHGGSGAVGGGGQLHLGLTWLVSHFTDIGLARLWKMISGVRNRWPEADSPATRLPCLVETPGASVRDQLSGEQGGG